MISPEQEYQLIGDIYDASLDGSRWPVVMRRVAEVLEARSAIITGMDVLNPGYNILTPHNLSEECLREYREQGWDELDMRLTGKAFVDLGGVGRAGTLADLFGSFEHWKGLVGDYYHYCRKWNMSSQVGIMLEIADFRWCCVGVHRTEEEGFFGKDDVAFLDRIGLHLRRGLQIHRQLSLTRQHNAALYAFLEKMAAGVLLLNTAGRVMFGNPAAEEIFRRHPFLRIVQGSMVCEDRLLNRGLQQLIRGAIETSQRECNGETGGVIGLTGHAGATPVMLSVLPLSAIDAWQDLRSDNIAAAIFMTDPGRGHRLSERLLRENYQLNPREIELCQGFVNTSDMEALAGQMGLTASSVRTYIKSVFEKTGQHSQADLMRLLMGLTLDFQHIR